MIIKDKRSIFLLFIAMVVSSIVIGSYCQTKFVPVQKQIKPEQTAPLTATEIKSKNRDDKKNMQKQGGRVIRD